LRKSWRSEDEVLLQKLKAIRTHVPKTKMFRRILRNHKAWSNHDKPNFLDLQMLFRRHPETTVVTATRKGANHVNKLAFEVVRRRKEIIGEVPGDFDVNEDNYDKHGKLKTGRVPVPSQVKLFKGMRVHLTTNRDKANDFVNGMEATVRAYDEHSKCLEVVTRTNKPLARHLYTDPDTGSTFFPIRLGYASTIYKMQGATLPHVTIWMDRPSRAAAYVAMSRVPKDDNYLFGGIVKKEHFMPAY
jgi:hypothetical protein